MGNRITHKFIQIMNKDPLLKSNSNSNFITITKSGMGLWVIMYFQTVSLTRYARDQHRSLEDQLEKGLDRLIARDKLLMKRSV